MSATAAALYNLPAPGSQPPAPGRAGFTTFKADSHFAAEMGSRRARQLQPVGGDGAPVADMLLVDELSMAGANLLLPKAADAVASLTMTTIATMPDAMPLAMAQPVAQEVGGGSSGGSSGGGSSSSGSSLAAKRKHARSSFNKQMEKDVARLAKMAKWSKRREDAPAPTAITARRRHGVPAKIPPLGKSESFYKDWFLQRSNGTVTAQQ